MKFLLHFFVAMLGIFGLAGCLQIEKVVKLNADGSGTVEETVMMSKATVAQMAQMAKGFGDIGGKKDDKPAKPFDLLDEPKLKEAADKMGPGVTFVSAKKVENENSSGFTATYAFKDINTLQLDQNPGDAVPTPGGGAIKQTTSKAEPVTFKFTKGAPAELVIKMPTPDLKAPTGGKKEQPPGGDEMAMQMMKQMFKDMRITMAVEVAGTIKETNAEYKDGSRVTLVDMDFNKLLADPEKFKEMAKASPTTLQESKALLKKVDGVKVETNPEVKIKFQ